LRAIRPTRDLSRSGLSPTGKARSVFDGCCCILDLGERNRFGGWAGKINEKPVGDARRKSFPTISRNDPLQPYKLQSLVRPFCYSNYHESILFGQNQPAASNQPGLLPGDIAGAFFVQRVELQKQAASR
jgi:hypothetical protein